ncbi:hypothetical protein [Schleiferilactobacillus harbinensis]|uniref:Uncharacterized protein n=1 Tax=Schleiferilactobacillus harbinensis TaxID=304207 RepID=A0ABU7T0L9_9LACO
MKQFKAPLSFKLMAGWVGIYTVIEAVNGVLHLLDSHQLVTLIVCLIGLIVTLIIGSIVEQSKTIDELAEKDKLIRKFRDNSEGLQEQYKSDKAQIKQLNIVNAKEAEYIAYLQILNSRIMSSLPQDEMMKEQNLALQTFQIKELQKNAGIQDSENHR